MIIKISKKIKHYKPVAFTTAFMLCSLVVFAQQKDTIHFTVTMQQPENHLLHVTMKYHNTGSNIVNFKMPQWTTGYYQIMNYANNVSNFIAQDNLQNTLQWSKANGNTWTVKTSNTDTVILSYDVLADSAFVATSFIDTSHAYIITSATFMYVDKHLQTAASISVDPYEKWNRVATGLDAVAGKQYQYTAPDFDVLYDCPILAGNLEELPAFNVNGVSHCFIGYQLGSFDKGTFMADLKRIVEAGVNIIHDIPYKHYTFLGIGPGNGGIEHLTSSSLSFKGAALNTDEGRKKMLSFIAHEYFHTYNVKRIRPIELGPFDYDKGSETKQLWISEGWTVYYEYLLLKRSEIISDTELYSYLRGSLRAYETQPGRHFQSLAQASENTWSDGPFGRKGDEINKTISYYDKGPIVALMLDFAIRNATQNKQSLDDVLRSLYNTFYKQKNRGFTEAEFWNTCTQIAGKPITEIHDYVYTTKELNYAKYFAYGGLHIDTTTSVLAGAYTGLHCKTMRDTLTVVSVDGQSPAWQAGVRMGATIISTNGQPATLNAIETIEKNESAGTKLSLIINQKTTNKTVTIVVAKKLDRSFVITPLKEANPLQASIRKSWLGQ